MDLSALNGFMTLKFQVETVASVLRSIWKVVVVDTLNQLFLLAQAIS